MTLMIKFDPHACGAIKMALLEKGLPFSIRIEIRSAGCCDASLRIAAEKPKKRDLFAQVDGLTIAISPATHDLVGDVSISCVDDGFLILSDRPLNEWAGFAASSIRICEKD